VRAGPPLPPPRVGGDGSGGGAARLRAKPILLVNSRGAGGQHNAVTLVFGPKSFGLTLLAMVIIEWRILGIFCLPRLVPHPAAATTAGTAPINT
jgi:hypothetical protein